MAGYPQQVHVEHPHSPNIGYCPDFVRVLHWLLGSIPSTWALLVGQMVDIGTLVVVPWLWHFSKGCMGTASPLRAMIKWTLKVTCEMCNPLSHQFHSRNPISFPATLVSHSPLAHFALPKNTSHTRSSIGSASFKRPSLSSDGKGYQLA